MSALQGRFHEIIGAIDPKSATYRDCVAAIKFDLGDMDGFNAMADVGSKQFCRLPAPLCLFQVVMEGNLYVVLAKEASDDEIHFTKFGKTVASDWEVYEFDLLVRVGRAVDGLAAIKLSRPSTGEDISLDAVNRWFATSKSVWTDPGESGLHPGESWTAMLCLGVAYCIEVFSCTNVIQVEHKPPKIINEARKRKNKVPFFSFRTIHVTGEREEGERKTKGGHASPRLHFRRGHIRKLANGSKVWVRHCLVGDKSKGFAAHDYSVRMH